MSDPDQPPTADSLIDLLDDGTREDGVAALERVGQADGTTGLPS